MRGRRGENKAQFCEGPAGRDERRRAAMINISAKGIFVVVFCILAVILVSIQFTLNLILKELREIKKLSAGRGGRKDAKGDISNEVW